MRPVRRDDPAPGRAVEDHAEQERKDSIKTIMKTIPAEKYGDALSSWLEKQGVSTADEATGRVTNTTIFAPDLATQFHVRQSAGTVYIKHINHDHGISLKVASVFKALRETGKIQSVEKFQDLIIAHDKIEWPGGDGPKRKPL